jgi:RHS repeat-associated protein
LGHLTSVSTAALGTTPATVNTYSQFDTMGRVLASSQQIGSGNAYGFTYAYDHSGALASTLYPSGRTVTNTFDSSGRISAVNGTLTGNPTTPYAANVQYAAQGPVQSLTMMNSLGNNVLSESWSFNARQQPSSLTATSAGGTQLMNLGWTYSPSPTILTTDNGDILTHTIARSSGLTSPVTQNFSYADPSNRLSSAYEGSSVWSQSYGYDAFGNRAVTAGVWPGLTPPMPNAGFTPQTVSQFNNQNQWKRGAGDSYDAAGNQLSVAQFASFATAGSTFSYDGENRLLTANMALQGGPSFVYDGEGRRVQKTSGSVTITYIHDAKGDLAAEYSTAPDPAVGTQYLSDDHLGSTRLITDWNGIPQRCFDYLPFGEEIPAGIDGRVIGSCYEAMNTPAQYPTSADVVNQKFTGKERDAETGLDYFGARYFSAAQGRFTSPDWSEKPEPVPYAKVIDPQTLNLYAYVRNNPLRSRDADGHEVDLTGDDKAKAEEQKRITANASKKGEAALFKTVTDKSGKTRLVLDKAAAADFKGTHSAGYNLLVGAIDAKPVATVEMVDHDSTTTLYANGNATVHLDWNVSGIDKVVPLIDPKSPQKNQMPFSIIAGHELLGHALANMLHVPGANLDGPGTPVWGVEQTLRQEQGLIPRPDNMP